MSIKTIKERIDALSLENSKVQAELELRATAEFKTLMESPDKQAILESLQQKLDNSRELTCVQDDEYIHRWVRFDASSLIDTKDAFECILLKEYLRDQYCFDLDVDNDAVSTAEGPCIVINDDGDILDQDSGKWILSKTDYLDDDMRPDVTKRNELIEAYMEKRGCYPGVIKTDYYGNPTGYVNTKGGN